MKNKDTPLLNLISESILTHLFPFLFTPDVDAELMTATPAELEKLLIPFSQIPMDQLKELLPLITNTTANQKALVWIYIALRHPEASDVKLIQISDQIGLSLSELARCAIALGKLSFVEKIAYTQLLQVKTNHQKIEDSLYRNLETAASFGQEAIVHFFAERLAEIPVDLAKIIEKHNYAAPICAAENSHFPVIEYFANRAPEIADQMAKRILDLSLTFGHKSIVEFCITKTHNVSYWLNKSKFNNYQLITVVSVANPSLEILAFFVDFFKQQELKSLPGLVNRVFHDAIYSGNEENCEKIVAIMDYLANDLYYVLKDIAPGFLKEAIQKAFHSQHYYTPKKISHYLAQKAFSLDTDATFFKGLFMDPININDLTRFTHIETKYGSTPFNEQGVYPLVCTIVNNLADKAKAFYESGANRPFDLEVSEQIDFCYYLIRNLIRPNPSADKEELFSGLFFLLGIPAVRTMLFTRLNQRETDQIVKIASESSNTVALELLNDIKHKRHLIMPKKETMRLDSSNNLLMYGLFQEARPGPQGKTLICAASRNPYF